MAARDVDVSKAGEVSPVLPERVRPRRARRESSSERSLADNVRDSPVSSAGSRLASRPRRAYEGEAVEGKTKAPGAGEWEDTDHGEEDDGKLGREPSDGGLSSKSSPSRRRVVERPVGLSKRASGTPTRRRQLAGGPGSAAPVGLRSKEGDPGTASSLRRRSLVREDSGRQTAATTRARSTTSQNAKGNAQPQRSASQRYILLTIDILVRALRITAIILQMCISILTPLLSLALTLLYPLLAPILGILALSGAVYFLPSLLTSRLISPLISWPITLLWRIAYRIPSPVRLPLPNLSSLSLDIRDNWAYAVSTAPFRYIAATPVCTLSGALCEAAPAAVAPIWAWNVWQRSWRPTLPGMGSGERHRLDVGRMADGLSTEVRHARDIFDSVAKLGTSEYQAGLDHLVIHELAAAVGFSSQLDDKEMLSQDLFELGNMIRDLSDHVMELDSTAVSSFRWIAWDFQVLLDILPPPPAQLENSKDAANGDGTARSSRHQSFGRRPSSIADLDAMSLSSSQQTQLNRTLSTRIDNLVTRLDEALSSILRLTTETHELAQHASDRSDVIHSALTQISRQLANERALDPVWKHALDVTKQRLTGGPRARSEIIREDIELTKHVLGHVDDLRRHVDGVRKAVKQYRNTVGVNKALMIGFHSVSGPENEGIEGWDEVRVLGQLVGGLIQAVDSAKAGRNSGRTGKISGRPGGGSGKAPPRIYKVSGPPKDRYEGDPASDDKWPMDV